MNRADSIQNTENQLIELLPRPAKKRFLALCDPFDLVLLSELSIRGTQLSHAYFPRSGFISMVLDIPSVPRLEVGMVGREAMLGSELLLGLAKTPWRAVVVGAGTSWRIKAITLRKILPEMPELEGLLKRTLMVRLHQQSLASTCDRFHSVSGRLARWLLMSHDRALADQFRVTHEFISFLLGVRRSSVTIAAYAFQNKGLIRYNRGELKVLDRIGLEGAACSCYGADKLLRSELMKMKT